MVWVKFNHADVGEKTRHDNRHLYVQGIQSSWTPINRDSELEATLLQIQ